MLRLLTSRLLMATAITTALPGLSAWAATKHHRHHPGPDHAAALTIACDAPIGADQHDPSVREIKLQRDPDGSGVVTMCLVSKQPMIINPSASIGIFGTNGVLAGTAARAVAGKFSPAGGQGQTVVPFSMNIPADPPMPSALQPTAMIQLAWDSCPDDACAKPVEQSLALLLPMRSTSNDGDTSAASPRVATRNPPPQVRVASAHDLPTHETVVTSTPIDPLRPVKHPHHRQHASGTLAAGNVY